MDAEAKRAFLYQVSRNQELINSPLPRYTVLLAGPPTCLYMVGAYE